MTELPGYAARPWTQTEDDILRLLALAGASSRAIAHKLDRAVSSVGSRAKRLNVTLKMTRRLPQMG